MALMSTNKNPIHIVVSREIDYAYGVQKTWVQIGSAIATRATVFSSDRGALVGVVS